MNAEAPILPKLRPRWRRRLSVALRRSSFVPMIELSAAAALIVMGVISYFVLAERGDSDTLLTPPTVALLLVANLVPAMALMVLIARRLAMRRAARSPVGGRGRLHVRLVAVFSVLASVPTLMVVVFASLLFQSGVEFWFSDRARGMIENAAALGQAAYNEELERVNLEAVTMASDLEKYFSDIPMDSLEFSDGFGRQVYYRSLNEAVILTAAPNQGIQTLALANPYDPPLEDVVTPQVLAELNGRKESVIVPLEDRIAVVTNLDFGPNTYLYVGRLHDREMVARVERAQAVLADYNSLVARARSLQLRFNAALLLVSLLIVGLSIWVALKLADRLVRPVGELVEAARRVTAGDLSARVPPSPVKDEVATLGSAFNRMTERLEAQTGALVAANEQLESRRALIEAVLSGVTAGVISVDNERRVRLINSSAAMLLKTAEKQAVGRKLGELAPELDRQLDSEEREDIVQLASGGEPRTLAVKDVKVEGGHVITFDDITDQLMDQRRAAWSDVARRIAHEIKNPLTPIQLAAERLQRRYGEEVSSDASTFRRLTETIVRQVGDLRRMVDEFSSFARMPKPVFREEPIAEVARQVLFLHEVAHPDIRFSLDAPEPSPILVCDRRQIGQALTNIVKNAVEAIQQKREEGEVGEPKVAMRIGERGGCLLIEVKDTGIGLPPEKGRLTEPYMTTRAKGTGLGLAIVKKIVEEHFGRMEFEDLAEGGTCVRLIFDIEALSRLGGSAEYSEGMKASG